VDVQNLSTYTKGSQFVLVMSIFTINSYTKNEGCDVSEQETTSRTLDVTLCIYNL